MRILVTGATGYIGVRLVHALASHHEYDVIATGRSASYGWPEGVRFVQVDLSQPCWTDGLPNGIDVVVHLAQSKRYRAFPEGVPDVVAVNVRSTVDLADWSYRHGVRRFLLASTGTVYPTGKDQPLREDDPPNPASLYGASKLSAELLLQHYGSLFDVVLMRIFGVYGPGQTDMLIPSTIRRIIDDEEITLAGGVGLYVSPLFVTDCVAMISALIRAPSLGSVRHVNLAGPEAVSLAQIVAILESLLARRARIVRTDAAPIYLVGSGETARRLTGHESFVSLAEGLRRTVKETTDV